MNNFEVVHVDRRWSDESEPLGTKSKFWYRDAENKRILFKAETRGTGEDWAERVSCELCQLLGLPHVQYELAKEVNDGTPGVICHSCTPGRRSLVLGNQLLRRDNPSYPEGMKYKVRQHTTEAIAAAVGRLGKPIDPYLGDLPEGIETATDVFAGYLMLDVWTANQDRHDENWAAVDNPMADSVGRLSLAPTFDHGAGLARNLTDSEREDRLSGRRPSVAAFASKAKSAIYLSPEDKHAMRTLDAFVRWTKGVTEKGTIWLKRLAEIEPAKIRAILDRIPDDRISPIGRDFTQMLLEENQRRLLELIHE